MVCKYPRVWKRAVPCAARPQVGSVMLKRGNVYAFLPSCGHTGGSARGHDQLWLLALSAESIGFKRDPVWEAFPHDFPYMCTANQPHVLRRHEGKALLALPFENTSSSPEAPRTGAQTSANKRKQAQTSLQLVVTAGLPPIKDMKREGRTFAVHLEASTRSTGGVRKRLE